MSRSDFKFSFPKRVRYAEIDAQAIVFNSRYLEYFDLAITEYWRSVGMYENAGVTQGPEFHVARALVEYKASIKIDEMIDICVRCARIGTSSMTFLFEIHGGGADDLRASGEEISVHVGHAGGRSAPVPQTIIDMFERYEGRSLKQEPLK
jgi:acyl-CoA thioester hydrolase